MAKNRKSPRSSNNTQAAAVVLGLFALAVILFFVFSKHREAPTGEERIAAPVPMAQERPAAVRQPSVESQEENGEEVPEEAPAGRTGGKIAFIIDDWGQTTWNCKYLKEIKEPIAVSILPGLRHTKDVAACAGMYHKLAMLHLPLEALHNYDFYPQNYIIKTTMSPALVSKIVDEDMAQLPSIQGVNNHMGSKATEDRALMKIIFKRVKRKGLFFVDSMTSPRSVSAALADEMHLPFGKRDVFLDNINTREAITKQLMVLAQKAHRRGYAVAIGHDRKLTMQVIKEKIPWLESQGFEIVSIKDLLRNR